MKIHIPKSTKLQSGKLLHCPYCDKDSKSEEWDVEYRACKTCPKVHRTILCPQRGDGDDWEPMETIDVR